MRCNVLIALDIEASGLTWWSPDFQVRSIAFAWRDDSGAMKTLFCDDPQEISDRLESLKDHSVLVYNASYDISVIRKWYPEAGTLEYVDVMRLRQLRERVEKTVGYGLKAAVKQHLRGMSGYEDGIKEWIRANVPECKKGKEGQFYDRAPRHLLEEYNVADARATYLLFEAFVKYFEKEEFDWTQDHELYVEQVSFLYEATLRGIQIDKEHLRKFIAQVDVEVENIDRKFNTAFPEAIGNVRERLRLKEQAKYKKKVVTEAPEFNTGSKQHLEMLFIDELGNEVTVKTPTGRPSFKSSHLGLYGAGGKLLEKRGKRLVVQSQAKALLEQSEGEADARYHPQLKVVATSSGRLAGSGGVNIQGVSRKEVGIMGAMVADDGKVFVEQDLVSGEPTLITHYSKDPFYRYTNIEGRGKRPFVKDGLLWIDDPYMAFGWVCGLYSDELKKAWEDGINGVSFADQWLKDAEVVKGHLKKYRQLWKMLVLALGYSMMPKKLQFQVKVQFGINLSLEQAQEVYNSYWRMFSGVKALSDTKGREFKRTGGQIITPFGFLCWPKAQHAAMNQFIQSQVSSIMVLIAREALKRAPYAEYVTVIHDACIYAIPLDKVEDFRKTLDEVSDWLNNQLQWSVRVATGFAVGRTWADLK
jgi:DNA polymerase I-like protein with 3'-5' exonuclease and polymerase domains